MIAFADRITTELKDAVRAKDQVKMDVLRAMKSALTYKEVEKKQAGVSEEEAIAVFNTMIKQRRESIEQYEKFGRPEAAAKEKYELSVIQSFLPQQLSAEQLKALIAEAISASGAKTPQDLGKVMKELKPKVSGRADGKEVTELVKSALSS